MYKNVQMLSLILDSTKLGIFDEINAVSYVYNVSRFGDLWNAFAVYSVREDDIENGVDFSLEYCSHNRNITLYISYKMERDFWYGNEIGHHVQWLLRNNEPLNIEDAVVSITSIEGAQSCFVDEMQQKESIASSYKQSFVILLACFIAFVVLQFIAAIVGVVSWRRKNGAARANEQDGDTQDDRDVDIDHDHEDEQDSLNNVVEMQMAVAMQQDTNQQQPQPGEPHIDRMQLAGAQNEGAMHVQPAAENADIDIVSAINQTVFD